MSEAKVALKQEICLYFHKLGVDKVGIAKLIASIKADANDLVCGYNTLAFVAPRHRKTVTEFIDRLALIESQEVNELCDDSIVQGEATFTNHGQEVFQWAAIKS